jgi:EpsI family protein
MTQLLHSKYIRVLSVLLVAQSVLFYTASHGDATPLAAPLMAFPHTLGGYQLAQEGVVDAETLNILKADDTLTRWYVNPAVGGANLFIAFFQTQRTGQSPHSPKNCLPGSGWQTTDGGSGTMDAQVPGGGTIHINHYLVSRGEEESLVLYWYQSHGRVIADEFAAKFYLIADSIRKHRSDTALVRVVVPVVHGQESRAETTAADFVKASYPTIKAYLPQ